MKTTITLGVMLFTGLFNTYEARSADSPADVVWGSETNGICAGLFNWDGQVTNKQATFEIWLRNSVDAQRPFVVPKIPFQFDLWVFDENEKSVLRTAKGQKIGEKLPKVTEIEHGKERELQRVFLQQKLPEAFKNNTFNLFDYFQIAKPGKYRIEFEQRLQIPLTANSFESFVLPKVTTYMQIK